MDVHDYQVSQENNPHHLDRLTKLLIVAMIKSGTKPQEAVDTIIKREDLPK